MRQVKCASCGLVNLESFPAFPECEGCGSHLSVGGRRWLPSFGARPVKTLVWAFSVGVGVATLALLSVGISRETRLRDRGALVVAPFIARGGKGDLMLSLHVQSAQNDDTEPMRNLRLRLNQRDAVSAKLRIVSPTPSSVQQLAAGRYFVWNEFTPREVVIVRLQPTHALVLTLIADGFEPFVLHLAPQKSASTPPRKAAN